MGEAGQAQAGHGFNTQPPEGGWAVAWTVYAPLAGFNTQPPEGGWQGSLNMMPSQIWFQHTAA